jgi:hypothetical protein
MRYPFETPSPKSEQTAAEAAAHTLEQAFRLLPAGKALIWLQRGTTLGHFLKSWRKGPDSSGAAPVPEAIRQIGSLRPR